MLPVQTLLVVLTGMSIPPIGAMEATGLIAEPIVIKVGEGCTVSKDGKVVVKCIQVGDGQHGGPEKYVVKKIDVCVNGDDVTFGEGGNIKHIIMKALKGCGVEDVLLKSGPGHSGCRCCKKKDGHKRIIKKMFKGDCGSGHGHGHGNAPHGLGIWYDDEGGDGHAIIKMFSDGESLDIDVDAIVAEALHGSHGDCCKKMDGRKRIIKKILKGDCGKKKAGHKRIIKKKSKGGCGSKTGKCKTVSSSYGVCGDGEGSARIMIEAVEDDDVWQNVTPGGNKVWFGKGGAHGGPFVATADSNVFFCRSDDGGDGEYLAVKSSPSMAVFYDDDGEPGGRRVMQRKGNIFVTGEPGGPGEVKVKVMVDEAEIGGAWVGIHFGPVPKPLAAHLDLDSATGMMILDVIDDSPADDAGLTQYGVIVAIDGEEIPSDMASFLKIVRGMEPDDVCKFTIVDGCERRDAKVTIGARPASAAIGAYKFGDLDDVEELIGGNIHRRGGLLEKLHDGKWHFKSFDGEDMPDVWKVFPHRGEFKFDFYMPGKDKNFIWMDEGAHSLRIEKGDDGKITVTRTEKKDGEETTTTKIYEDEDELKKDDPETYDRMHGAGGHSICTQIIGGDGEHVMTLPGGEGLGFLDLRSGDEAITLNLAEILGGTEGARKHVEDIHKKLREHLGDTGLGLKDVFSHGKARTSFELLDGGKIRVTKRRGGEELVETFKDAEALKAKRPKLYRKYMRLRGDDSKKASKR